MHLALLTSPTAGGGAAARVAGTVVAVLRGYGHTVDTLVGADVAATERAARVAVATMTDALVVLGGDGLAHLAVQAVAHSETALGVIPAGTGNDLARALGLPADPLGAAHAVGLACAGATGSAPRPMDLGRIAGGGWFATVACAGFDAQVNARANRLRHPAGPRRYDVAILATLAGFRPRPVRVQADDTTLTLDATLVAVGNTGHYGGGIPVCPRADPRDGLLDVTVLGALARTELLRLLPTLRTGAHLDHPAVTTLRARSVHLGDVPGWQCYADGEPQPRLPVTLLADPAAVHVIAPGMPDTRTV